MGNTHGTVLRDKRTSGAQGVDPSPPETRRKSGRTDKAVKTRSDLLTSRRRAEGGSKRRAPLSEVRWLAVESDAIDAIAWKAGTLYVRFKETKVEYEYFNVPWSMYCRLTGAARSRDGSVGRVFNIEVRPVFRYQVYTK